MSLTAEQLELRKTGIGGSEISALLGESAFDSPFDIWLAKTQGWVKPETEDMRRGQHLEDGLARWYAQRFAIQSDLLMVGATVRHATNPVALCTPDRLVPSFTADGLNRLVSIKAPRRKSDDWGEPGTDAVPAAYLLQLQWEHAVCASHGPIAEEMHLAALLDGELAVYFVQADLELQAWLLEWAGEWWVKHVEQGVQPSLEGSSQAREWLKRKFPRDAGEVRAATPHETRLLLELQLAQVEAERWSGEVESLTSELKLSMGAAQRIDAACGYATWKADKNGVRSFRTKFTNKEK